MHVLLVSSLYPNNVDPKHGIFIETRLKHLLKHFPETKVTVIAPSPWFPFKSKRFGEYANFSNVLAQETIKGITVYHPKYPVIPKVGMYITPFLMALTLKRCIKKLIKGGDKFDVIDGHYFYPDGVAIAKVAKSLKIPFTCTARGSDIHQIPQYPVAKKMIQKVFKEADHLMAVCNALAVEMVKLGADEAKVTTLRNGVDLTLFKFANKDQQLAKKEELGIKGKLILSVGRLIELKGHYLVINAISQQPDIKFVIAGDGPDQNKLKQLAIKLGIEDRIMFLGALTQPALRDWYQAADLTVLASSREGWANVLLESMASGTPVVATNVWGTPEIVADDAAGLLVDRTIEDINRGINKLLTVPLNRQDTRTYAEKFDWRSTSQGQYEIFNRITQK